MQTYDSLGFTRTVRHTDYSTVQTQPNLYSTVSYSGSFTMRLTVDVVVVVVVRLSVTVVGPGAVSITVVVVVVDGSVLSAAGRSCTVLNSGVGAVTGAGGGVGRNCTLLNDSVGAGVGLATADRVVTGACLEATGAGAGAASSLRLPRPKKPLFSSLGGSGAGGLGFGGDVTAATPGLRTTLVCFSRLMAGAAAGVGTGLGGGGGGATETLGWSPLSIRWLRRAAIKAT